MKRTVPWAIVAFFPLVSLVLVTAFQPESSAHLSALAAKSSAAAFLLMYWWAILFAAVSAQLLWFLVAALRNRALAAGGRVLWVVAMLIVGPLAVPVYWWANSAPRE